MESPVGQPKLRAQAALRLEAGLTQREEGAVGQRPRSGRTCREVAGEAGWQVQALACR